MPWHLKLSMKSKTVRIDQLKQDCSDHVSGVDHAWKVSEKKSLHRRMERKQRELESDKLILQKRRDFLRLVEDGLARMRERLTPAEDRMDRRDDSNDNWGRELGLRESRSSLRIGEGHLALFI